VLAQCAERGLFEPLAMARKISAAMVGRWPAILRSNCISAVRAGHGFPYFVVGSEGLQLFVQILSSRPRMNQPSGANVQYRADHRPAPCAERGLLELPPITLNIFQHHMQTFRCSFPHRFICHPLWHVQESLFAGNAVVSTILGLRVINQSCYSSVLTGILKAGVMVQGYVVYFSGSPKLNLPLSQTQDCFVVGIVRAQRLSHFRCLATVCNGAG
jgi:hypothetical protein